jgi:hypothetical protein
VEAGRSSATLALQAAELALAAVAARRLLAVVVDAGLVAGTCHTPTVRAESIEQGWAREFRSGVLGPEA